MIRTNVQKSTAVRPIQFAVAFVVCQSLWLGRLHLSAQETITTTTNQSGGIVHTPLNEPNGANNGRLTVSHESNDPWLNLTNAALRTATNLNIGRNAGERGSIRVEGGSILRQPTATDFTGWDPPPNLSTGSPFRAAVLGENAGSVGTVVVTGAGSRWENGGGFGLTSVGNSGTGYLTVADGGYKISYFLHIGQNAGSNGYARVTGANSRIEGVPQLHIGSRGTGDLRIEDGGRVQSSSTSVGAFAASNGTVLVNGAGSHLVSGGLSIGSGGTGSVLIENGGTVTATTFLGDSVNSEGTMTVTGTGSAFQGGRLERASGDKVKEL